MTTGLPCTSRPGRVVAATAWLVAGVSAADPAVHLRARVGVLVEARAAGVGGRERVRARGDGLRLERLAAARRRATRAARRPARSRRAATALTAVSRRTCRAGTRARRGSCRSRAVDARPRSSNAPATCDAQRRRYVADAACRARCSSSTPPSPCACAGTSCAPDRACAPPARVAPRERRRAAAGLQQHADGLRPGRCAQRGARVVVGEDVAVARAVQRVAVGAVLAHPDAVPEAGAADREAARLRGGGAAAAARQRRTAAMSERVEASAVGETGSQGRTLAGHTASG